MTTHLEQRKQQLVEQVSAGEAKAGALQEQIQAIDVELAALADEQPKYDALKAASEALATLQEMGAESLFWGDSAGGDSGKLTQQIHDRVAEFDGKVVQRREAREEALAAYHVELESLDELDYHLTSVSRALEDAQFDFVVERELEHRPYKPAVMPWDIQEDDRKRLRKSLLVALLLMLFIGGAPHLWTLPEPDPDQKIEVPERLVQMLKKKQQPKPVEQPKPVKQDEEKPKEDVAKKEDKPKPKPTEAEVKQARDTAQTKGVLAFKDSFSSLIDDAEPSSLGADARVSNAGSKALGGAPGSRSMVASQATGGSGGIANASISRGGVGAGGNGLDGVATGQVTSSISTVAKDASRPVSAGAGPARTDEEIQIVFDRYKSALYRLYNRELRNDPTLRGRMMLAITIEPDGSVSACKVQSTDMNSPTLSQDVVNKVLTFNFGAKEGVPQTKILYPIDFLPAG